MGQVNGRGRFSTLHSSESSRPIFMKLETYNYFPDTTPHAKFQGPTSTWVVWANSQFDVWKFLSFFSFLRHAHRSHFWTHPNAQYVIIRRFRQGSAFWRVRKIKFEIWPLLLRKNIKIVTLSWRTMENCSRPNSGTVRHFQFKLGTRIDNQSGITWRDSKVKRSKYKVTT